MDVDGMADFDGCGLSRYNTLTPKQLVYILNYMKNKSKYFSDFYNSLAISGRSGTLAGICKGTIAEGRIHGKSGTIRAVKCYTGYVTTITGRELAFAMMINNYNGREYAATKRMEQLMVAMAGLNL
jgi:D-alanyl-D-alanine carboxypeptidase/D-alanyl-D-alanine-endopeptidase (penicillin-binding protein 4)